MYLCGHYIEFLDEQSIEELHQIWTIIFSRYKNQTVIEDKIFYGPFVDNITKKILSGKLKGKKRNKNKI